MAIRVDDIVILGTAVPDLIRDGRKTVCMAAWHEDLKLIRIYPCRADMGLKRWQIIGAAIEKNPMDTRHESWKLHGSHDDWDTLSITYQGAYPQDQRRDLLERIKSSCTTEVNKSFRSLAIIKPEIVSKCWLIRNPTALKIVQPGLEYTQQEWLKTKADFPYQPKLAYSCHGGCPGHEQSIIEWGAFEWMRKHPENVNQVVENWKFFDDCFDHYLLVGNQAQHRNAFIVISIIPLKRKEILTPTIKQLDLLSNAER